MDAAGNNNTLGAAVSMPYDYLAPTVTMRFAGAVGAGNMLNISDTAGVAVVVEMEFSEALAAPLALHGVAGTAAAVAGGVVAGAYIVHLSAQSEPFLTKLHETTHHIPQKVLTSSLCQPISG